MHEEAGAAVQCELTLLARAVTCCLAHLPAAWGTPCSIALARLPCTWHVLWEAVSFGARPSLQAPSRKCNAVL
jgi:hypothetical protein